MLRNFFNKIALLAVAAAALALPGKAAHADLKFTNHFAQPVYVLMGFYDPNSCGSFNPWRAIGWYKVERGQTVATYSGNIGSVSPYWYYYATSEDRKTNWTGDYDFMVNLTAGFDICDTPGPGVDKLYFRQADVGNAADYTITLY
jgi:uncharacterized membrane protein